MSWFVAFPVRAGAWFDALTPPEGMKKEGASDLHLTVAFLGKVDESQARAAFETARGAEPPPRAVVKALAPLGNPRRPSVIAAIIDSVPLAALMTKLRDPIYDAAGVARDERPALPHVTIARIKQRGIRWAPAVHGEIELSPIALYRSGGATKYEIVVR